MKKIIFTTYTAVEDAYNALQLLAHCARQEEHYSALIDALKEHEREQRETILLLTSEKLGRVFASEHYQDMDTAYPPNPIPR